MIDWHAKLIAKNKATQSECRYKISALGFNRKGELVIKKTNKNKLPKLHGSIHAEMAVMMLHKKFDIKTILICRVNKNGKLLPIVPCCTCKLIAKKLGIKILTVRKE